MHKPQAMGFAPACGHRPSHGSPGVTADATAGGHESSPGILLVWPFLPARGSL